MATKERIFSILSECTRPLDRDELGKKLGESYRRFQTQLDRWERQGLLKENNHCYSLTDAGREEIVSLVNADIEFKKELGGHFHFSITQQDLDMMSDEDFGEAWSLIGKVIRIRRQGIPEGIQKTV